MDIFHLLYFSTANSPFSKTDLELLLATSAANNEAIGVTGMLIYRTGFFIQLLEGEESAVKALYAKIEKDPRHRESEVLLEYSEGARLFPQWFMGAISEPLHSKELIEMVKTLQQSKAEAREGAAKQAISMLKAFSNKYSKA